MCITESDNVACFERSHTSRKSKSMRTSSDWLWRKEIAHLLHERAANVLFKVIWKSGLLSRTESWDTNLRRDVILGLDIVESFSI